MRARILPVSRGVRVGAATPLDVFRRLRTGGRECFLLESVEGSPAVARYSFLGVDPDARVTARGNDVFIERRGALRRSREPLLETVAALTLRERFERDPDVPPFCGGAVGYVSYDAVRQLEEIPDRHPRDSAAPDALFLRFDSVVAFDHRRNVIQVLTAAEEHDRDAAGARLDRVESALQGEAEPAAAPSAPGPFLPLRSRDDFLRSVETAKEAILAGEIYQVVLSQRWSAPLGADPLDVYAALRDLNPSPYLFYLETREATVLGASPEMLVRTRGRDVETRPIAGTAPRGIDSGDDARLASRLLADPKERAEHVMLVDLARNDLGRVCEIGSVRVTRSAEVERYSHVQHLVSEVHGTMAERRSGIDALAACFPAGTLTGAPKIRAMELIDDLEGARRGIYGGAVGYVDVSGDVDMAIAIRTAVVEGGVCRVQAGAGIVADSIPENEYREAQSKAAALFRAVDVARSR